jgi:hypothetical protein
VVLVAAGAGAGGGGVGRGVKKRIANAATRSTAPMVKFFLSITKREEAMREGE